ncbi:WD repeat-containing protein 89-like isoform X2 [Cyprinus carpio]|uniref:WD repeat-containing protein 89 n=1 Tax=Cyprinus carpio TaxID=7962 RepID=A0A9R0B8B6_CYPCA|nr:WD repeat-containing protein 89-like isoform X2 [Cyprinus carpio]
MDSLEDTFRTLSIARRLQPSEAMYILDLSLASCASSVSDVLAVCCSNHSVHLHSRETLRLVGTEQVEEDSFLVFWDVRMVQDRGETGSLLGVYSESHSDDITTVKFHPRQADRLASGATDGLVNVFDLSLGGEDDALVTTCNCNSSASSLCWTGKDLDQLLCLTHDEGLHLWDVARPDSDDTLTLLSSADARPMVQLPDGASLEYFVGGTWLSDEERILLVGGSNHGELHLLDCSGRGLRFIKSLRGGHSATVRCFQWDAIGRSLLTGGEDGQLLQWKAGAEEISVGMKDSLKSISSIQLKTKAHRKQATQKGRSKLA